MRTPQGKWIGDLAPIARLMHREDRNWRPTVYGRVVYEAECALLDAGGKIKYSHIKEKQGNNRHRYKTQGRGHGMPSTQYFGDLYGVTEERALNFWSSNLHEAIGSEQWSQIRDSTGVYLASLLGHFCLQSVDRTEILSADYSPGDMEFRQFADLTQIAELMMQQLTSAKNPLWMESAGAHILLYAGFFQDQNKNRHNIEFYSTMGRECYLMAAVGKRTKMMKLMATDFNQYLFHLANLHRHLRESRYLIRTEN